MSVFWAWTVLAAAVAACVIAIEAARRLLAGRLAARWPAVGNVAQRCAAPAFVFAAVVSASTAMPYEHVWNGGQQAVAHALRIAVIGAATWLVVRIIYALTDPPLERLTQVAGDRNRRARRTRTQMLLLRRIGAAALVVLAVGGALFTFPAVRTIGAGVLASAGIAGVVIGVAAKPAVGNLIAGLQLAFGDALRLDDVVVVNGEWGRIEELTLSYVVVRSWDERRIIFPVSYFTEQPFENWTRHSTRLYGSVELAVDWSVPLPELREELRSMLREHPLWDGRDWALQATDVLPNGLVKLRATMTAADSGATWDLRCAVREHLVAYIRENHPDALPRFRTDPDVSERPRADEVPAARAPEDGESRTAPDEDGHGPVRMVKRG